MPPMPTLDPRLRAILMPRLRAWLALLGLLVLTTAAAYVPMAGLNTAANLVIAAAEAAIAAVVFMSLDRPDPLLRLAAGAALFWLAAMFALTFADLLTRAPPG